MRPQSLPAWHVLRSTLYMLGGLSRDNDAIFLPNVGLESCAFPYPCHDDHPAVSFWGGEQS